MPAGQILSLSRPARLYLAERFRKPGRSHFELPLAPVKPIDLQITVAAPGLNPELQTGTHELP